MWAYDTHFPDSCGALVSLLRHPWPAEVAGGVLRTAATTTPSLSFAIAVVGCRSRSEQDVVRQQDSGGEVVEETVTGDGETQATEAGVTGGRGQLELLGEPLPRLLTRHMSERVKCFRHV